MRYYNDHETDEFYILNKIIIKHNLSRGFTEGINDLLNYYDHSLIQASKKVLLEVKINTDIILEVFATFISTLGIWTMLHIIMLP